jgi:hypothetical protein
MYKQKHLKYSFHGYPHKPQKLLHWLDMVVHAYIPGVREEEVESSRSKAISEKELPKQ